MQDDTHPKIREMMLAILRQKTSEEKVQDIVGLIRASRQMALARLRQQYGPMSEEEERLRLIALWHDRETMIRVWGWDPEEKGW